MQDAPEGLRAVASRAPMLAVEEEEALIEQARAGSRRAVEKLLLSHLRMVFATARRYRRNGIALDDLVSEGTLGLLEAIDRFEPGRGTRLASYAAWWVRAYVRRFALDNRRVVGPPETRGARRVRGHVRATERRIAQDLGRPAEPQEVASALGVRVEDLVEADAALRARDVSIGPAPHGMDPPSQAASPESEVSEAETRALVKRRLTSAFDDLTARERQIVLARHLNDDRPSLNLLGERLGVSRERVRQLQLQAEHKLRSALLELVA